MSEILTNEELAALAAPSELKTPMCEASFEALCYVLREGPSAMSRPDLAARLQKLTDERFQQIVARLIRVSPSNATPWKPSAIRALAAIGMFDV